MWSDQISHPEHLTYESGALPTALRGPVVVNEPPVFKPLKVYCTLFSPENYKLYPKVLKYWDT